MRLLEVFSGEGGASKGFQDAGWEVYAVDIKASVGKRTPADGFAAADAFEVLYALLTGDAWPFTVKDGGTVRLGLEDFDAAHGSPPCQGYTIATAGNLAARAKYPRFIGQLRYVFEQLDMPWVIENVELAGKEMNDPVLLCGRMFGLGANDEDGHPLVLDRHRLFEANFPLPQPEHPKHGDEQVAGVYGGSRRSSKPNATPADDRYAARYERKGGYVPRSKRVQQELLGIDWMTVKGMQESIPPVYAQWVGHHMMNSVIKEWAA